MSIKKYTRVILKFRTLQSSLKAVLLLVSFVVAFPINAEEAFLTPESGGRDYLMQGEFTGIIDAWGGAYAAQSIALGNDEFTIVLFAGGLPGDGYRQEVEKKSITTKADGKTVRGIGHGYSVKIEGQLLTVSDERGKVLGELQKVQRQSPTLGLKPTSKDALMLFDGTNVNAFRNGGLMEEKFLGVGCETTEKFGNHHLHLEFRTPFMPTARGQKRGNSGLYLQARYEVQILDSFGLDGKDNECGGIYKVSEPKVNMCFPPLVWQTYDIDFTAAKYDSESVKIQNARVTIRQNGVVIHEDLELPTQTPGKYKEANEPGPLFLQDHHDPVVFRNIWLVKK